MSLEKRIATFIELGKFLSQFNPKGIEKKNPILHNDLFFDVFSMQIKRAKESNSWFTEENVLFALNTWSKLLNKEHLIHLVI